MSRAFDSGRFVGFVGGFAAKGPFFGWIVVWLELLALLLITSSGSGFGTLTLTDLMVGIPLSLAFAYGLGIVPAVLTGVACYFLSSVSMPVWRWVVSCAGMGGAVSLLALMVATSSFAPDPMLWVAPLLPGAGAGGVCAWQARKARLAFASRGTL
ncbi:hypothetical protein [Brevundimonas sp.]|jgi:hypothetical protein|uniref:hypothetical protein n=1 Tax=Brevundimonas sp. TaxID=1871086 RepID=UPI003784E801